jgi:hypothetical protein
MATQAKIEGFSFKDDVSEGRGTKEFDLNDCFSCLLIASSCRCPSKSNQIVYLLYLQAQFVQNNCLFHAKCTRAFATAHHN